MVDGGGGGGGDGDRPFACKGSPRQCSQSVVVGRPQLELVSSLQSPVSSPVPVSPVPVPVPVPAALQSVHSQFLVAVPPPHGPPHHQDAPPHTQSAPNPVTALATSALWAVFYPSSGWPNHPKSPPARSPSTPAA
ncbi:hypothetical protein K456DRAFT_28942 [Colletotrichum gloeosporioides 23]|nr:hypothetical protein K456DRAFT_28942 [Colletotrichum gloeosporioides 23]